MTELLSIGEVANRTDTAVSALRYYDDVGLVEPATRVGGKRRFAPDVVDRVRVIRVAQEAGFSLTEIAALLADDDSEQWRQLVRRKLDDTRAQAARLDAVAAGLAEALECGCEGFSRCCLAALDVGETAS